MKVVLWLRISHLRRYGTSSDVIGLLACDHQYRSTLGTLVHLWGHALNPGLSKRWEAVKSRHSCIHRLIWSPVSFPHYRVFTVVHVVDAHGLGRRCEGQIMIQSSTEGTP